MELLVKIEVIAEKILLQSRSMDPAVLDQALQATYALKKAIEFEYYQKETQTEALERVAAKLSQGEKLLGEQWTAKFFFKVAQDAIFNLCQGAAEIPESFSSTDEALACLASWVDSHAGLRTRENAGIRIS